jgi:hypothetical protein
MAIVATMGLGRRPLASLTSSDAFLTTWQRNRLGIWQRDEKKSYLEEQM